MLHGGEQRIPPLKKTVVIHDIPRHRQKRKRAVSHTLRQSNKRHDDIYSCAATSGNRFNFPEEQRVTSTRKRKGQQATQRMPANVSGGEAQTFNRR